MMTTDERNELQAAMEKAGAGQSMLYQRMAYRGFDEWEITGIDKCTSDFWEMVHAKPSPETFHTDESCISTLCGDNTPAIPQLPYFWQTLVEQGLNAGFIKYMGAHGMSRNTTIKRFSEPNFKPWELQGVENILRSLTSQ